MAGKRPYDVVLWGATGFTGGLVCEYLAERYASDSNLKFAIGGRNKVRPLRLVYYTCLPRAIRSPGIGQA